MALRRLAAALAATVVLIVTTSCLMPAQSQPARVGSEPLAVYSDAVERFKAILHERADQIAAKRPLPDRPGQALYLARTAVMSAYKDLTDAQPAMIGRPNKFGVPPAYFDAGLEPLIDEYLRLFAVMQAAPGNAQNSPTPFEDVVRLGNAIGRAVGLGPADARTAGQISLGMFFAETNGLSEYRQCAFRRLQGQLPDRHRRGPQRPAQVGRVARLDFGFRSRADRARRQGGGAGRHARSPVQSLDRRARRPDERACRGISAAPSHREGDAESDRSDEALRIDPDCSVAHAFCHRVRQYRRLSRVRSAHHGLSAQQQHFRLRQGRQGANLGELSARFSMRCGSSTTSSSTHSGNCRKLKAENRIGGAACAAAPPSATRRPIRCGVNAEFTLIRELWTATRASNVNSPRFSRDDPGGRPGLFRRCLHSWRAPAP